MRRATLASILAVSVWAVGAQQVFAIGQLHAYYPLDEGTGLTVNDVWGSRTGTLTNFGVVDPWTASPTAPIASANPFSLTFGANNGHVNLGDMDLTSGALSLWIRPTALGGDNRIFGQLTGPINQGGAARLVGSSALEIWSGTAWLPVAGTSGIGTNVWRHLVFNSDGSTIDVYLDGSLAGSVTSGFNFDGPNFGLGARFLDSFGSPFVGQIDDVAFFSQPLTPAEVSLLAGGISPLPVLPLAPEPASLALFALLMLALGLWQWRRG